MWTYSRLNWIAHTEPIARKWTGPMDGDRHVTGRTLARHLGAWRTEGSGVAYIELADRIKLLVLDGRLPTRTRVPAERELAAALLVSRTTVAASYELLRQTGFLHSRRGS